MRAVIAIDSLKGSLSSIEAGQAIAKGIRKADAKADVVIRPLADGGEVLLPAIKDCILSVDMEKREMQVHVLDGLL